MKSLRFEAKEFNLSVGWKVLRWNGSKATGISDALPSLLLAETEIISFFGRGARTLAFCAKNSCTNTFDLSVFHGLSTWSLNLQVVALATSIGIKQNISAIFE